MRVEINLNPYQGLKLYRDELGTSGDGVEINLNPYQGLKHSEGLNQCLGIDLLKST